ncbi:MAG: hypothetical protein QGF67_02290 [Lentisphaeria bacterium]|nr:hypothetical protein [Lentisphaeria bacterium]MDP7740241.1 hypothetical protein [Lentisphaeria bacterium]
MRSVGKAAALFLAITMLAAGCVVLQPVKRNPTPAELAGIEIRDVHVRFTPEDAETIRLFYIRDRATSMPITLAWEPLPLEIERQVKKGYVVPKKARTRSLPRKLERQLSHLPRGYKRLKAGTDVIIINTRTKIIVDHIREPWR